MVQNGPKWSKMVQNGLKWSKMGQNWSRMVGNGPKWSEMVKHGLKRPKIVQNGPKWPPLLLILKIEMLISSISPFEATLPNFGGVFFSRARKKSPPPKMWNGCFKWADRGNKHFNFQNNQPIGRGGGIIE